MQYFYVTSTRLMRFLYSLGFNKESFYVNGIEKWKFVKTKELMESVHFYNYMRKKNKI